jgi:signal transduction histidine kinase
MSHVSAREAPGFTPGVSHWAQRIGAYWMCQVAGWSLTALVSVVAFASYMPGAVGKMAIIYAWGSLCGIALTHAWRGFLRRHGWLAGGRPTPWARMGAAILLLGLAQTAFVSLGFAVMRPPGAFSSWGWLPGAVMSWTFVMVGWTALYATISAMRRANRLESEALRLAVHATESELRALQAQVNPHFFFNSLNSVRALIYENPEAAARMVDQLAGLMRYALQEGGQATVPLAREMEAVGSYLAIEKIRFEARLNASLDVDASLEGVTIPPMAVQTLVENAVKHGVERNPGTTDVRVSVRREAGGVRVEVANRGRLAAREGSTGVGLVNTRKRLALVAGAGARLELVERDGWVIATLVLPSPAEGAR